MIGENPRAGFRSGDRYFCRSREGAGDAREDDEAGGVRGLDEDPRELVGLAHANGKGNELLYSESNLSISACE